MKKKVIQLLIGLAISGFFIWFAFFAGGVRLADLINAFKATNWWLAIPMMLITMASFYWRCFRWKILLDPVQKVTPRKLYGPLMIGFAFNNIFPMRAGEAARPFALMKQEKIPFAVGLSTIVVERLVDVMTLLILLIVMPLFITFNPDISREFVLNESEEQSMLSIPSGTSRLLLPAVPKDASTAVFFKDTPLLSIREEAGESYRAFGPAVLEGTPLLEVIKPGVAYQIVMGGDAQVDISYIGVTKSSVTLNAGFLEAALPKFSMACVFLFIVMMSFLVPSIKNLYIRILHMLPLIPKFIKLKLESFILAFAKGFDSLKSPKAVFMVALHSAIIWASVGFSFQLMSWGFPGVALNFYQAMAFVVVTCVVISIPSSPGFWGLYEFGGMVALLMMGIVPDTPEGAASALAFTLVVHFLQWVPITIYGLWAAAKLSVGVAETEVAEHLVEEAVIAEEKIVERTS